MTATDYRPLLKNALLELRELRAKLDDETRARDNEPLAIIGMACRFPGGANGPAAFWRLLAEGRDAITEVPKDRWDIDAWYDRDPSAPNKMITRWGGFIDEVDRFDREFFGMSAREAASTDPQHRLLLETTWEALEDALVPADALRGSSTGVFLGAYARDYSEILEASGMPADAYMATGNGLCFAAGRLAYVLDLQGPAITLDTACSSSLVAIDSACQALRRRRCDLALAGGVNVILTPTLSVVLSKLFALSPNGRCRAFDAAADGFVRGEGCGMVVLKRLSDALHDGDDVLAVIRSSVVNQDGNGTGLTAPNVLSQQALLRMALAEAGIAAADVGMIEAHGTGTPLGDPIEMDALKEVLGGARPDGTTCAVTSVKTNFGHLEAAAGIAGVIKSVLSLRHRQIPPHLHLTSLNPHISLEGTPFVIPTELRPWETSGKTRIAGVSSFGMSGTNAHIVLEEAPRSTRTGTVTDGRAQLITLSARSPEALRGLAAKYAVWLGESRDALADIAYTTAVRRSAHRQRLALVAATRDQLQSQLLAFSRGERRPGITAGESQLTARAPIAFIYSGQGAQWVGMGLRLLEEPGVFRDALDEVDAVVREQAGWSIADELQRPGAESRLAETEIIQPVLFGVQVALTALWRSWGVSPDVVVGHSVGEIAAAYVGGALALSDAVTVALQRGQLMQRSTGFGRMVAVDLGWDQARRLVAAYGDRVAVGAHNGPRATVLSGDPPAIAEIAAALEKQGVGCRSLRGDYAFHSAQMDPYRSELARALGGITPRRSTLRILSTVTGQPGAATDFGAAYWARNIREPVLFAPAIAALLAEETSVFVEIGAHPVLSHPIAQAAEAAGKTIVSVHSLRRDRDDGVELLSALGELWTRGMNVDWRKQHAAPRALVRLPTYAWQRERCWVDASIEAPRTAAVAPRADHPLLGAGLSSSLHAGSRYWQATIGSGALPYLGDHRVAETVIFPAAAYLEMAVRAATESFGAGAHVVEDVELREMLVVPADESRTVQLAAAPLDDDRMSFQIASLAPGAAGRPDSWIVHAEGILRRVAAAPELDVASLDDARARCTAEVDGATFYQAMRAAGLDYGPQFQSIARIRCRDGEAIAELAAHPSVAAACQAYHLHPAILDACFQALAAAAASAAGEPQLPVHLGRLQVFSAPRGPLVAHARLEARGATMEGDVVLFDHEGRVVMQALGLRSRPIGRARDPIGAWLHQIAWEPQARSPKHAAPASWIIVTDAGDIGQRLASELVRLGDRCQLLDDPTTLADRLRSHEGPVARGVIYLAGELTASPRAEDVCRSEEAGCERLLATVQALSSVPLRDPPRLTVVTRQTQPVGAGAISPAHAGLWGFARTLAHEHPELRPACIDLGEALELAAIAEELRSDSDEPQIALRGSERYVARLVRQDPREGDAVQPTGPAQGRSYALAIDRPGVLDRLHLRERPRRAPLGDEVEIQVHATGLNFLDVLLAIGMLPDNGVAAGAGSDARGGRLGAECAGVVTAVGAGVSNVKVGDEVIAIGVGCFASHVITSSALTVPKPPSLSMAQAAAIPVTFLTAHMALVEAGRLAAGERVLIHAAAGGVGMAAVQIAKHIGAEIFATAGSDEKRALLRAMGVPHVMDSRSLSFATAVKNATNGEGIDVVMNSLAGEFIAKSFDLLRDYGRFVEIGKRDYLADHKLGLRPFLRNLSFSLVDVGAMMRQRPARLRAALLELLNLIEHEALALPPIRVFPASEAADAFRYMAQAKHTGKIVVSMNDPQVPIAPALAAGAGIHADATYLVTGGLGGLGLEVAKWMVARGARHVVLMGRGAPSAAARRALDELTGAEIAILAGDVARSEDVKRVLDQIARTSPPLRGVIHAAGVLDDGVVSQQTAARFSTVMAPKVRGAWNLHELTRELPLDFFVLFSSAASVLGSPGQSNYATANACLDALAHVRRAANLPALAINWGAWTDVGMAAATANRGERLAGRGLKGIAPAAGIAALERLLAGPPVSQIAVLPIGAQEWKGLSARTGGAPFLARLVEEATAKPRETAAKRELFGIESIAARRHCLETKLRGEVANVLRIDPGEVDPQRPLRELGIDSLMAIELRNALEGTFGVALPSTVVWNCPTISALGAELARKMELPLDEPAARDAAETVNTGRAAAALEDDAMVAALLSAAEDMSSEVLRGALQAADAASRTNGVS